MQYGACLMLAISFKNTNDYMVRMPVERPEKQLTFNDDKYHRIGSFCCLSNPLLSKCGNNCIISKVNN